MSASVISRRTWATAGGLVALFAVTTALMVSSVLGEWGTLVVSDFGSSAVNAAAAAVIMWTAWSYGRGEAVARQWWLIGIAVGLYAAGDFAWAFIEVVQRAEPWPSIADVFYSAEYVFMFAGIILAVLAYRRITDIRLPLAVSAASSLVLSGALYYTILGPKVIADPGMSALEKFVSAGYPIADVLLLIGPSLAVALILLRLGTGRLAWPWWLVVSGAVLLAASDAVYSVMTALGTYVSGSWIDYGWMAAHLLVAFGALLARDVARV